MTTTMYMHDVSKVTAEARNSSDPTLSFRLETASGVFELIAFVGDHGMAARIAGAVNAACEPVSVDTVVADFVRTITTVRTLKDIGQ